VPKILGGQEPPCKNYRGFIDPHRPPWSPCEGARCDVMTQSLISGVQQHSAVPYTIFKSIYIKPPTTGLRSTIIT